eukprot:scaffold16935_cov85-Attheya_sp.AAC.1
MNWLDRAGKVSVFLDRAGKASAFLAWLFENFAYEMFFKGGSFQMTSLGKTPTDTVSLQVGEAAGHYKSFKKQKISDVLIFQGRSKAQILASDCHEIKGIGPEKKRKLNDGGIKTVGDVLRASKDNKLRDKQPVRSIRHVIEEFQAKLDSLDNTAFIQRIPQYVIGIDYKKAKS